MASDEIKKKWGTIFMGNREASVQQLQAMQEPLQREKKQKDQAADYMERVRSRAADRAREILGAAYAERQKVLEEARADAARFRKDAETDCARLKAEGEKARADAMAELNRARSEREEAEKIRLSARDAGYQEGMKQSASELSSFRADLGQSLGSLLRAIERERHQILEVWRDDIVNLVQCASEAGSGYILEKEHKAILRNLVFKSLDLLENRSIISLRVNPQDEEIINDMFRSARERFPELKQWVVTGDAAIERGGLLAESGTGSVDMRRENFREMVEGVLSHLGLPPGEIEENANRQIREMVEKEVASIAAQTPELDKEEELLEPENMENGTPETEIYESLDSADNTVENTSEEIPGPQENEFQEISADSNEPEMEQNDSVNPEIESAEEETDPAYPPNENPTLEALEEELFPIDEQENTQLADNVPATDTGASGKKQDPLAEGGFL